jgi:hypothetical protein
MSELNRRTGGILKPSFDAIPEERKAYPQWVACRIIIRDGKLTKLRNDRCSSSRINYIKFGRSIRYSVDDVISYMEDHKIRPNQDQR